MVEAALNTGILSFFIGVFVFLLAFALTYGFLTFTRIFGDDKEGTYGLLALAVAIIVAVNPGIVSFLAFVAPWFFIAIFFGFFILFVLMIFGLDRDELEAGASEKLRGPVISIAIIILIFGLANMMGDDMDETNSTEVDEPDYNNASYGELQSTNTGDTTQNVLNTLRNPQVLGMVALLLIAAFAMFLLTQSPMEN